MFSLPSQGQMKSSTAGILLQATLAPSLTMSAAPLSIPLNSFMNPTETHNLPVTVRASWVRGSGEMSVVALTTADFQSWRDSKMISVIDAHSETTRELRINSTELKPDGDNRVLTIRAQAL
jgi:hypothetical protein